MYFVVKVLIIVRFCIVKFMCFVRSVGYSGLCYRIVLFGWFILRNIDL